MRMEIFSNMDDQVENSQVRVYNPLYRLRQDNSCKRLNSGNMLSSSTLNETLKCIAPFQSIKSQDPLDEDPLDTSRSKVNNPEEITVKSRRDDLGRSLKTHTEISKKILPTCNLCDKVFTTKSSLRNHMRLHSGEKPFICPVCNKGFSQKKVLKAHESAHSGKKPFTCPICSKGFSYRNGMYVHIRLHSGEKPHVCEVCGKGFAHNWKLKSHMSVHTGEKPYICDICEKAFTSSDQLKIHHRNHTDEKPYTCNVCFKGFTINRNLTLHMRVHTGEKPYICETCGKRCTTASALKTHLRVHTGEKPYVCTHCDKAFTSKGTLKAHLRAHNGEKPYLCTYCDREYADKRSIKKHLKKHKEEMELDYSNEVKGNVHVNEKAFSEKEKKSKEDFSERKTEWEDNCGEEESGVNDFIMGEAKVKENHLEEGTKRKEESVKVLNPIANVHVSNLITDMDLEENVHVQTHKGRKSFGCDHCGKFFSRLPNLKRHMLVHTGEKPYSCNRCSKQFALSYNLKLHMRVHSFERPHVCNLCGKKYADKKSLINHVKKHEEEVELENPLGVNKKLEGFVEVMIKEEVDLYKENAEDPMAEVIIKEEAVESINSLGSTDKS